MSVYVDDIRIFSPTLGVFGSSEVRNGSSEESISEVKASEMHICQRGSGTSGTSCPYEARSGDHRLTEAVQEFPKPKDVHDI